MNIITFIKNSSIKNVILLIILYANIHKNYNFI